MKAFVLAVIAAVFAGLEAFGIQIPADIKQTISDNTNLVVAALAGLVAAWPMLEAAIKKRFEKPAPDEHSDVSKQRGSVIPSLLCVVAVTMFAGLFFGCATVQKDLPPDVRAAAVMRDAKAVAETCADLYEKDRISVQDGYACLAYVDQAISYANAVHFLIATATAEKPNTDEIDQAIATAEEIIKQLRAVLV